MTTFRLDYKPHDVIRRSPKATKQLYIPPDGTMMLTSTYAEDYKEHQVQKVLVNKKKEKYCNPSAKMASMSLYKEEFKPWCVERLCPFKFTDNLQLSQGKFVNTTTFQDEYRAKGSVSPRRNLKPIPQLGESLPFDGTTNYKLNYVTHPVQSRQPRIEKYRPTSASFHGESIYKQDFKGLPTEVPKPIKANVAWESNCITFNNSTGFHDQHKPSSMQPNQSHKAENSRYPEDNLYFLSTTHADYVAHKYQRIKCVQPLIHTWEKDKEPFHGISVMKKDYQPWGMACQPSIMYVPGTAKSPGTSRSEKKELRSQDRHKAKGKPNTCMIPSIQNEEPVLKDSCRDIGKPQKTCPASFAQPPGFEYTGTTAGHTFYRSVGDGTLDQEPSRKE